MAINNRPLKAYVRFDGTGRIVPSSVILRKNKPKVGKWQEIPAYECCNYTPPAQRILYFTPVNYPITNIALRFFCNGNDVEYVYTNEDASNFLKLIQSLTTNSTYTQFGVFSALDSDTVQLTMSESLALTLCPTGTLTFDIVND